MNHQASQILVVDDERGMRLTLSAILTTNGYLVKAVENGDEAIAAASETSFGVIFLDIIMPRINGIETLRAVKKISPSSKVIMMTGFTESELVHEAMTEGAFAVIYKPFDVRRVFSFLEIGSLLTPGGWHCDSEVKA